jgi:hypothetical protein
VTVEVRGDQPGRGRFSKSPVPSHQSSYSAARRS